MIVHGDFFISGWLRNRNAIEFLCIWESVHNPHFNYGEFALIKSQAAVTHAREAGLLNVALFGQTAREWRDANPGKDGDLRDFVAGEELAPKTMLYPCRDRAGGGLHAAGGTGRSLSLFALSQ